MAEIDSYQDSSAQSSDDVESSNGKSDSEDESSRDTQTDDEDEDPCLCQFLQKTFLVVHPYLTPTVREPKKNYLATLKPYVDEVKDTILDTLKANLKGVIVLTSSLENVEDEYLGDHNPNQPCENSVPSTSKDESILDNDNFSTPTVDDEILSLAIVNDDLAAVDEYFAEKVDEEMKEEEMKEEETEQDEEKMTEKKKRTWKRTMKKKMRRS
uniref:Uncharacterized protein n=1 Tax=Solanum tuberosum TaxID=4113 RepID=M1DB66_SOLTU